MIYLNSIAIIFIKNTPANQSIIQKYAFDQKSLKIQDENMYDKNKASQLINFFKVVDWPLQFLDMNIRYLELDPTNCAALQNVILIYQKQKSPLTSMYVRKYLQNCK